MRHLLRFLALLASLLLVGALSGCGGDAEPEGDGPTTVEITIAGEDVTPLGERVPATVGEPITFRIDSDTAGELHLHTQPEQVVTFEAGESSHEVTIDKPGIVAVESHELEVTLVQLEVR